MQGSSYHWQFMIFFPCWLLLEDTCRIGGWTSHSTDLIWYLHGYRNGSFHSTALAGAQRHVNSEQAKWNAPWNPCRAPATSTNRNWCHLAFSIPGGMTSRIIYHRLCPGRDDIPLRHFAVLCCHPAVECCTAMLYSMYMLCTGKLLNGDSIWWLTSELMDVLQTYPCNSHGRKVWKLVQAFKYIQSNTQMVLFDWIGSFTLKWAQWGYFLWEI
jgi:hypothetical protein